MQDRLERDSLVRWLGLTRIGEPHASHTRELFEMRGKEAWCSGAGEVPTSKANEPDLLERV